MHIWAPIWEEFLYLRIKQLFSCLLTQITSDSWIPVFFLTSYRERLLSSQRWQMQTLERRSYFFSRLKLTLDEHGVFLSCLNADAYGSQNKSNLKALCIHIRKLTRLYVSSWISKTKFKQTFTNLQLYSKINFLNS